MGGLHLARELVGKNHVRCGDQDVHLTQLLKCRPLLCRVGVKHVDFEMRRGLDDLVVPPEPRTAENSYDGKPAA